MTWWEATRGDRPMPVRDDLDPPDLRRLLSAIILLEWQPDADDFHYRVLGTGVTDAYGRNSTGRTVRQVYDYDPVYRDFLLSAFRTVARRGERARMRGDLGTVGRDYRRFDMLTLPLGREDGSVGWLVSLVLFD